jgi:HAD superfamily hydrolase (TIGR01509 family)
MSGLRALLWDVDGTLAETEGDGHRVAFNEAFAAKGLPWRWDDAHYGALLRITGGRERLMHDMATRSDAPAEPGERERLARELHALKNQRYAEIVASGALPLRAGVAEIIEQAHAEGLRQAIVTTTSRSNVEALLQRHFGSRWTQLFPVRICGEDVQHKKPDPEAYRLALDALRLSPLQALAIEDAPGGSAAATAAGVPVVVTRSRFFGHDAIQQAVAIGPGLDTRTGWRPPPSLAAGATAAHGRVTLADLQAWYAAAETVSA